jgi:hypothetical protein
MVLFLLIVGGILFYKCHFYKHFSSVFGCVGRLCFLSVYIPDMHVSLLFKKKGYQHDILQRSAINCYAYLFGCTTVAGFKSL